MKTNTPPKQTKEVTRLCEHLFPVFDQHLRKLDDDFLKSRGTEATL